MIGIWLDSLGLGAYVNELAHAGVQTGEGLAACLNDNGLEARLGMKKALHRKKLALAISAKQELAAASQPDGSGGVTVVDAAGKLDHYWVTRW